MGLEAVFAVDSRHHGKGTPLFSWHPRSQILASTGPSRVVHIWDQSGRLIQQIIPSASAPCIELAWQHSPICLQNNSEKLQSSLLAMLHEGWSCITLFDVSRGVERTIHIPIRDPCLMKWNRKDINTVAVGGSRGELILVQISAEPNLKTGRFDDVVAQVDSKHRKRITCGDWNCQGKFAFASDDRQITVVDVSGRILAQVKLKAKPTLLQFGGSGNNASEVITVCMDQKSILLYNLNDPENALELAFQAKYGNLVAFQWFKDSFMMLGFSLGYFVVISTNMAEIGREQFCAKFHSDSLRNICYCPIRQKVATCGESSVKIVDMVDWKEQHEIHMEKDDKLEHVDWTKDGKFISASTKSGIVYTLEVETSPMESFHAGNPSPAELLLKPLNYFALFVSIFIVISLVLLSLSWVLESPVDHIVQVAFEETFRR